MTSAGAGPEERRAAHDQFDQAMAALLALDKIQGEAGNAFELISRAAECLRPAEIDKLEPQAQRSIRAMDGLVSDVRPDISSELFEPLGGLRGAMTGDESIFSWVRKAMAAKSREPAADRRESGAFGAIENGGRQARRRLAGRDR